MESMKKAFFHSICKVFNLLNLDPNDSLDTMKSIYSKSQPQKYGVDNFKFVNYFR